VPVCDDCSSPMWTRKRLGRIQSTYEEDSFCYECRFCHTMLIIRRRNKPVTKPFAVARSFHTVAGTQNPKALIVLNAHWAIRHPPMLQAASTR
jgi:hypothetical protein